MNVPMRFSATLRSLFVAAIIAGLNLVGSSGAAWGSEESGEQSEVSLLIDQLGDSSYATRIRAREKLQRMGLEAFDELHLAQFDPDNEIAMSARFLVSSLSVRWSKESDPPEVRETLMEYGSKNEAQRSSRIDMLAEFPSRKGLGALVRLARFETSLRLSRRAALALMQQPMSSDEKTRKRNAELVLKTLEGNDRQASEWLRVYAEDLSSGSYSVDRWRQLIADQRYAIDSAATQQSSRPSVLELVRVCATRAAAASKVDEALRLANENIDLIAPTTRQLIDACSWAIDNRLHPFVLELRKQHTRMFDKQPILLYGAAEAKKVLGEPGADALAQQALQIRPLPKDEAEKAKMQPKEVEETAQAHREIGMKLQERGLFHWAEKEFRQVIDSMEINALPSASARTALAEMLANLQRHEEVVEVLKPLTERVDNDDKFKQQLNMLNFFYSRVRSDLDYHTALAWIEKGKLEEAKPKLIQAFQAYPNNIDILISMYRLDGDDDWKRTVQTILKRTIRQVDSDVEQAKAQVQQHGRDAHPMLAREYNQYAWLIANTEGDYAKALDYSLKSLELELDGAKLDTCARCYYALGEFDDAIRMQKRALKMMPHSPPLVRQLDEILAAKARATSSATEIADDGGAATVTPEKVGETN